MTSTMKWIQRKSFGEIKSKKITRKDGEIFINWSTKYWLRTFDGQEISLVLKQTKQSPHGAYTLRREEDCRPGKIKPSLTQCKVLWRATMAEDWCCVRHTGSSCLSRTLKEARELVTWLLWLSQAWVNLSVNLRVNAEMEELLIQGTAWKRVWLEWGGIWVLGDVDREKVRARAYGTL